jgi:hypothetical protein
LIAFGTSEAIDPSTPKPIDDHVANQNNIAIADQVTELPNGKLGNNSNSTSV